MKATIELAEKVFADLSSDERPAPPRFPCPACGRETSEHTPGEHGEARRICAMPLCRHIVSAEPPRISFSKKEAETLLACVKGSDGEWLEEVLALQDKLAKFLNS